MGDSVVALVGLGIVVNADEVVEVVEAEGGYDTGASVALFVDVDVESFELVDDLEDEEEEEDEDEVDMLFDDDVVDFLVVTLFAFSFSSSSGVKPYVNPRPCFSGL